MKNIDAQRRIHCYTKKHGGDDWRGKFYLRQIPLLLINGRRGMTNVGKNGESPRALSFFYLTMTLRPLMM